MKPVLLVLAAGIGSRYGGVKQMDAIAPTGENIIDYSIFDAIRSGFGKVVFVLNPKIIYAFKDVYESRLKGKIETEYILQELENIPKGVTFNPDRIKPWGTGHAILVAKNVIDKPFAVINADDFYGKEAFEVLAKFLSRQNNNQTHYAMVSYQIKNTLSDNGTVSRGICSVQNDLLTDVVERTSIAKNDNLIIYEENGKKFPIDPNSLVSMNFWGFTPKYFEQLEAYFAEFINENANNLTAEFYIPYVVNKLIKQNDADVCVLKSHDQWFGVTYKEDKQVTVAKINELIQKGIYPENLWK